MDLLAVESPNKAKKISVYSLNLENIMKNTVHKKNNLRQQGSTLFDLLIVLLVIVALGVIAELLVGM